MTEFGAVWASEGDGGSLGHRCLAFIAYRDRPSGFSIGGRGEEEGGAGLAAVESLCKDEPCT